MFSSRRSGTSAGDELRVYAGAAADVRQFPCVVEFLTLTQFDDGSEREVGTIRILSEGGRLKACFNDNAESRYGFVSLDSLTGLAEQLEHALEQQRVDWRVSKDARGRHK